MIGEYSAKAEHSHITQSYMLYTARYFPCRIRISRNTFMKDGYKYEKETNGCYSADSFYYTCFLYDSVNICDLLVEPPLTGANLLNLGDQMVKIVLVKDLPIDQSALAQNISLLRKSVQNLCRPLAELRRPTGIDPIPYGDDSGQ